jgi:hypothetical protein
VDPVPDPLLLRTSGSSGNRTRNPEPGQKHALVLEVSPTAFLQFVVSEVEVGNTCPGCVPSPKLRVMIQLPVLWGSSHIERPKNTRLYETKLCVR